jgi:hypothetical protein
MGTIKSIGGSPAPPSAQPLETAVPNPPQNTSAETGSGPATQVSQRDAQQRRTEHGMEGLARRAELQGTISPGSNTTRILNSARNAGLNQQELHRLETRLNSMTPETRSSEMQFMNRFVLGTPNSSRALRTYMDVRDQQEHYPSRISDSVVHTLTRAVAEPRSQTPNGREGVMSHQQALNVAVALTLMPQDHFTRLQRTLDHAGTTLNNNPVPGNDHYERALILKSLGARTDRLTEQDSGPLTAGHRPASYMQEIESFATSIRGMNRQDLMRRTTLTDIYGNGHGLQQAFSCSCAATTAQIAHSEADPIYAMFAHRNPAAIIAEQRRDLQNAGGVAVPRDESGGEGMGIIDLLNSQVSRYTGQNYREVSVSDSIATRRNALDLMAVNLRDGTDVPMRIAWDQSSAHFVMATDVRGIGHNRDFFITDPWTGDSRWFSEAQLTDRNTTFPGTGTGRLADIYVP